MLCVGFKLGLDRLGFWGLLFDTSQSPVCYFWRWVDCVPSMGKEPRYLQDLRMKGKCCKRIPPQGGSWKGCLLFCSSQSLNAAYFCAVKHNNFQCNAMTRGTIFKLLAFLRCHLHQGMSRSDAAIVHSNWNPFLFACTVDLMEPHSARRSD